MIVLQGVCGPEDGMITLMAAMLLEDPDAIDMALVRYRDKTRAAIRCSAGGGDDVVVCGARDADRYRVPLVENIADDRPGRRHLQALAPQSNCTGKSAFLVGCGLAGATVSVAFGPGARSGKALVRPSAP